MQVTQGGWPFPSPLTPSSIGGQVLSVLLSPGFPWSPTEACLSDTLSVTPASPLADLNLEPGTQHPDVLVVLAA